ncbi:MAG: hypothetical protein JO265_16495 [Acidimicrobiia bacterium]|nr:hypothetical protein [Acidimicrobiia bacterium]
MGVRAAGVVGAIALLTLTVPPTAGVVGAAAQTGTPASGQLSYTTFSPPTVKRLTFSYDGSTFTLGSREVLAALPAADGIVFSPDGHLLVGGGTTGIFQVDPTSGAVQSARPGGPGAWHVSVDPSGTKAWAAGLPGPLSEVPLTPFGNGVARPLTGDDPSVTSVGFAQGKAFYTASDPAGSGSFGEIDLASFHTTRLLADLRGAHGMTFDPSTGDLLLFGSTDIVQIDPVNPRVVAASRTFPGLRLDQGTVDGHGHLFAASNTGELLFIDYSRTGHIDDSRDTVQRIFVDPNLDDLAPLTGPGANVHHASGSRLVPALVAAVGAAAALAAGWAVRRRRR